jgi:AcrR family transcriptional regulator
MTITKGIHSKGEILENAREVFNLEGLGLTLAELALKLNTTLGRITYHFPTKDHLFVGLANRYEEELHIRNTTHSFVDFNLTHFYGRLSEVMDIQYNFRCVMRYVASSARSQGALYIHTTEQYRKNREKIAELFTLLVTNGSFHADIISPKSFEVILFQFVNLMTTWTINLELYDNNRDYNDIKPVYLTGIVSVFRPFLTPKGIAELNTMDIILK